MSRKSVERVELEKSKKRVMFVGGTGNKSKLGAICHARSALAACTAEATVTCMVTQSLGGHSRSDQPVPARVSHTGRAGASWPSPPPPCRGSCDFRKAVFLGAKRLPKLQGSHRGKGDGGTVLPSMCWSRGEQREFPGRIGQSCGGMWPSGRDDFTSLKLWGRKIMRSITFICPALF